MNLAESIASLAGTVRRTIILMLALSAASLAQTSSVHADPVELVRKAVKNEINASSGSARFMFRGTKTTPKGSTTKIYVETSEATAGVAVAYDGKPLTPAQRREEDARVERVLKNPEEMRRKRAQEHEDADRTMRMVRALPDAFLYDYVGDVTGTAEIGHAGDPLVKLRFHPNPHYRPPSHVEDVLTGMQGDLLLDAVHYRIASIDGTLFKEVSFGWGILGHLDRGGRFVVHQEAVEDNLWEISSMGLKFTGKILLIKSLSIESTEVFTGFKQVSPDLTYTQALEMLKKKEADVAENSPATTGARR